MEEYRNPFEWTPQSEAWVEAASWIAEEKRARLRDDPTVEAFARLAFQAAPACRGSGVGPTPDKPCSARPKATRAMNRKTRHFCRASIDIAQPLKPRTLSKVTRTSPNLFPDRMFFGKSFWLLEARHL